MCEKFAFVQNDLKPFDREAFENRNKGFAPWGLPTAVNDKDWDIARQRIELLEANSDLKTPHVGDRVIYTTQNGDYYPYARLESICGEKHIAESGSMYATKSGCHISDGGAFHGNLDVNNFKPLGFAYLPFWCFGRDGACYNGGIYFSARMAVWEYTEPEQQFPGFSTKDWSKWYVDYIPEPPKDSMGYKYHLESFRDRECRAAFRTEEEYHDWLNTRRGREFKGYWPNQKVVWCYKEEHISLSKDEWAKLDLPLDTRLLNAAIRDCKVEYDDDKHLIKAYFYAITKPYSFMYSGESDYPYEYKLEREKRIAKG